MADARSCCSDAGFAAAIEVVAGGVDRLVGEKPRVYSSGGVALIVLPGEKLTWFMEGALVGAVWQWLSANGFRGVHFSVSWDGLGQVGTRQITAG